MISKKAKRLAWDKMGYNETGEKIKFRIDEVIISSHGAIEGDMMEIGAATFSYEGEYGTLYKPNELERKSMNLLYLSCCLKRVVAMTSVFSWQNSKPFSCFILYSKAKRTLHMDITKWSISKSD